MRTIVADCCDDDDDIDEDCDCDHEDGCDTCENDGWWWLSRAHLDLYEMMRMKRSNRPMYTMNSTITN